MASRTVAKLPTSWNGIQYNGRVNALAIDQGGLNSYYSTQRVDTNDPKGLPVFKQDNKTGKTTQVALMNIPNDLVRSGVNGAASTVRGGINPTDGIYWVSADTADGTHHFWAYDTLNNINYGYVGYLTGTEASGPWGANGDLVFDQEGNLLFVTSTTAQGQLWRIAGLNAALSGAPRNTSTNITSSLKMDKLATFTTEGQFNGVTFDNDGYLYTSFTKTVNGTVNSYIQKYDPNTGVKVGSEINVSGLSSPNSSGEWNGTWRTLVDLADCNDPGGLKLQKDYEGRVADTDNVTLNITRKDAPSTSIAGGTVTTNGPATGLQDKAAAVAIGVPDKTYVLKETAGQRHDRAGQLRHNVGMRRQDPRQCSGAGHQSRSRRV